MFITYNRCKCTNCWLEFVVQHEECRCCIEVDRCCESMVEVKKMTSMLLSHPGFESVGLNSWVLATATIGLKTKHKKAFTTLFAEGYITDT